MAIERFETRHRRLRRFVPLALLLLLLAAALALRLDRFLSLEALSENRDALLAWVEAHGTLSALAFVAIYAGVIAASIPGGAVLTVTGGFLYGTFLGAAYAVIGATLGATALYLAARTALGDLLRERAGPAIRKVEEGFGRNAASYMLVLRLVPLFPFWLVNLVPALLGVPLSTYVATTILGIIPGSVVYAALGNGFGAILDAGGTPDLGAIFRPAVLLPLLGLALLSLLPVLYRRWKAGTAAG